MQEKRDSSRRATSARSLTQRGRASCRPQQTPGVLRDGFAQGCRLADLDGARQPRQLPGGPGEVVGLAAPQGSAGCGLEQAGGGKDFAAGGVAVGRGGGLAPESAG